MANTKETMPFLKVFFYLSALNGHSLLLFLTLQNFYFYIMVSNLGFMDFLCVCVSTSVCFSCTFTLVLFFYLLACFALFLFVSFNFICYYYFYLSVYACLYSNGREWRMWRAWVGKLEEKLGEVRGRETVIRMHCMKKNLFTVKI